MSFEQHIPISKDEKLSTNAFSCNLLINKDLPYFRGHFPNEPILPGVVQIAWAIHFGSRLGLDSMYFTGVPRSKFSAVIQPGMLVRLNLKRDRESLEFSFESSMTTHSSGTILYVSE
jgi:3-hydroxymyristoyl/3-hydroxydecanoyl-(acyl carrier protein) dehydratase